LFNFLYNAFLAPFHLQFAFNPGQDRLPKPFFSAKTPFSTRHNQSFLHGTMKTTTMKVGQKITCAAAVIGLAAITTIAAPPLIVVQPPVVVVPPPPALTVQTPAPPGVSITVGVPDNYTWDGSEYVGMVGDQYYYLGPGNAWLPMSGTRLVSFHDWEKNHHDWTKQAIRNDKYRRDAQGHDHPWHHE
jgi:hypothetical protein